MTPQEIFTAIEQLLPYLGELKSKGSTNMPYDKQLLLRQVYPKLYNVSQMNTGCHTCVRSYLEMLAVYYEREYPKYQASIRVEEPPVQPIEQPKAPTKQVAKKPKKK